MITDAGWLAECLPEGEVLEANPDQAVWKLEPKFSFIKGSIETTAIVEQRTPSISAHYRIKSQAIGIGSVVIAHLTFEPYSDAEIDNGCKISWRAEISEMSGFLKLAPKSLVQSTATTAIADFWQAIRSRAE